MKILMISTDSQILTIGTFARARMEKYANALGELHIIVLSKEKKVEAPQSGNLWVYTTRSLSPVFFGFDAALLALRIGRPEVITVQDPFETGLLGVVLSKLFWRPLHVQVHTDFLSQAFRDHSFRNRLRVTLVGITLGSARRIRVVAERIKEGIETRYHPKAPVTVIPIFVDTAKFEHLAHQAHEKSPKVMLVVSRLEAEKQIAFAIYALASVRTARDDIGLIIVGEGSERTALKTLAETLGVAELVEFAGRVDPLPYYAQADVLLLPSQYEGYGLVIIEALAAGVPVIATDVGVAKEAGAIIAPSERAGFVHAVEEFFTQDPLPAGVLNGHPYENEEEYIGIWTEDLMASVSRRGS